MLQVNTVTADKEWRGLGREGDESGSGERVLTIAAPLADVVEFIQAAPRLDGANDASVTEDASAAWTIIAAIRGPWNCRRRDGPRASSK